MWRLPTGLPGCGLVSRRQDLLMIRKTYGMILATGNDDNDCGQVDGNSQDRVRRPPEP